MARGKRAKENDHSSKWMIAGLMITLIVVQLLMVNDTVRGKFSIVDYVEGQQAGIEKK